MTNHKIANYLLYGLLIISVGFIGWFFFGGYVPGTQGTPAAEPLATDEILMWAFILLIIAAAASLIFPLVFFIMNPKNTVRALVVLGIIAILVVVSYSLASDQTLNLVNYSGPDNVPKTLKRADTGLILTYILAGIAILSILYTEIAKLFK